MKLENLWGKKKAQNQICWHYEANSKMKMKIDIMVSMQYKDHRIRGRMVIMVLSTI